MGSESKSLSDVIDIGPRLEARRAEEQAAEERKCRQFRTAEAFHNECSDRAQNLRERLFFGAPSRSSRELSRFSMLPTYLVGIERMLEWVERVQKWREAIKDSGLFKNKNH